MRNLALQDASARTNADPTLDASDAPIRNRPRSSDRVLQLLGVVGGSSAGMSLTEAAAAVGLVASTTLRQLRSLEASGLLRRDEDQLYRPGPGLVELARTVFVGQSLVGVAQPFLDELAHLTGESTYLAVTEAPRHAVYIATAPGRHALRHSGWLGRSFSTSGTAVGSALRGSTDADGVVSRVGRLEPGITAVSAPVHSHHGVVAAMNAVGPSFRLTGKGLAVTRQAVSSAAASLSAALGRVDRTSYL